MPDQNNINQVAMQLAQEMLRKQTFMTQYKPEDIAANLVQIYNTKGAYAMLNTAYEFARDHFHDDLVQSPLYQGLVSRADELNKLRGAQEGTAGSQEDAAAANKASASDLLKQFAQHMMDPKSLDPNDPYVAAVIRNASGSAQTDARMRGLQGGYAVANGERSVANAMAGVQLQRQQLGAQALGQAGQLDLGQARLALDAYNQQYQAQLQNLAAQHSNNQALGSAIGTGIGLIGQAYGIPGLNMQSGAQFGGGVAGLASGGSPQLTYQPPAQVGLNNRGGY